MKGQLSRLLKRCVIRVTRCAKTLQRETLLAPLEARDLGGAVCFQRLGHLSLDHVDPCARPGNTGA